MQLWRTLFQGEEGAAAGRESVAAGYSSDTDTNRRAFRGAVPGQSKPVLCSGFLKKAKDLNIGMWHSKYVQLRPGALVYSSDAQHIDDPKFQSIIPFDAKTCAFRPVNTCVTFARAVYVNSGSCALLAPNQWCFVFNVCCAQVVWGQGVHL